MKGPIKTYVIKAELMIELKPNAVVVQDPDCVAAAIRHYLRYQLPSMFGRGGYRFVVDGAHIESVNEKKGVSHE